MTTGIEIIIRRDSNEWTLRLSELTAIDERMCRKETGFTIGEISGFVTSTTSGLDTLAALEWLARRQNGESTLLFDAVARTVTVATVIDVDWRVPDAEESADPE